MAGSSIARCPHCRKSIKLQAMGSPLGKQSPFESNAISLHSAAATSLDFGDVEPIVEQKSFWASDGATYSVSGIFAALVILLYGWYADMEYVGLVAAMVAVGAGIGLHILKIWIHRPWRPTAPKTDKITFRGEFTNKDDGTMYLDDFEDDKIQPAQLIKLCKAIEANNFKWVGRPTARIKWGVSRTQHARIAAQFHFLNYIKDDGSLIFRGRAFVRQCAAHKLK